MRELNPNSTLFLGAPPEQILVFANEVPDGISSMIFIQAGPLGGHSYFGGPAFEGALRGRDEQGYFSDADDRSLPDGPPVQQHRFTSPKKLDQANTRATSNPTPSIEPDRYVKWISRTFNVPIIADFAWRRGMSAGVEFNAQTPLRSHLKRLGEMYPLMLKQRNGVVLARDRGWFKNPAYGRVPYGKVETLRARLAGPSPDALNVFGAIAPLGELDNDQIYALERQFPIAHLVPRVRAGLRAFDVETRNAKQNLVAPAGVRYGDLSLKTRNLLKSVDGGQWPGAFLAQDPVARMKLEYELGEDRVRLGYVVYTPSRTDKRTPTIAAVRPGAPLFIREETDEL